MPPRWKLAVVVEAANGNPAATLAWPEYHGFIEAAKVAAAAAHPRAFYVDLHGHGHAIPRLEWGYLLEAAGYPSVPRPTNPSPGTATYFDGGYSTARHGSAAGGTVSGVQLEMYCPGVRGTGPNRLAFAGPAARVLVEWLEMFP